MISLSLLCIYMSESKYDFVIVGFCEASAACGDTAMLAAPN